MKNKMSAKTKWAIGLLIYQALSVFSVASEFPSELYSLALLLSLHQILPHIGAIILIFYNNNVTSPNENFNPLQKWFFVLVWIQPAFSFLTYSYLDILNQVIGRFIGSCIFPAISCFLLYSDWRNPVAVEKNDTQATTEKKSFTDSWAFGGLLIAIMLALVLLIVSAIV